MTNLKCFLAVLAATYTLSIVGCGGEEPRRRPRAANEGAAPVPGTQVAAAPSGGTPAAAAPAAKVTGWGTIKGRLVWAGATPDVKNLDVTKDQDWCLKEGPIPDETLVVDPETKGLGNVFVYLVKPKGIHESYPQDTKAVAEADASKKFAEMNGGLEYTADAINAAVAGGKAAIKDLKAPMILDQVYCRYVPHAVAVREGERMLVLNYEQVAHNVKVDGNSGKNNANQNMPPNTFQIFEWQPETGALNIECSIHGWMKAAGMVFDHPYFTVTGKDGSFELKNVPAGANSIVLYRVPKFINASDGSKGNARGEKITVEADGVLDLGEIKVSE